MPDFDPPIYINCRDRVSPLVELVCWLEAAGHEHIVLLDNASTYRPLLEYLARSPHDVQRLPANYGSRSFWALGLYERDEWFVYTDPDVIPTEDCPRDLVGHLKDLLDAYPRHLKAGVGLYLDDLPEGFDRGILEWERSLLMPGQSWMGEIAPGVFDSLVDTTFALHRPHTPHILPGIRTGAPYQARHTSWYAAGYTVGASLSDEDAYYLAHASKGPLGSSWRQRVPPVR